MKRKITVAITISALLFVLVAGFVAADELLTLRSAVEQAVSGSPGARLASLGADKAEIQYRQVNNLANVYRYELNTVERAVDDERFKFLMIDTLKAEIDKDLAAKQKEVTRNQLALEAQKSYLRLYQAHEQKELMELSLERAQDIKRIAQAAFNAGTAAKSEVMRAESHVATMEATLFGAESGVKIAEAALNTTLGRDIASPVELESILNIPEVGEVDLRAGTSGALSKNVDIVKARAGIKMAETARDLVRYRFGTSDDSFEAADIGVEEANLALQLVEDRVRLEVFSLFQKLTGMEKQLAARQKALELAAENYRISKLRYELGVATQGEVTDAMISLSEQEVTLLNDKIEHYTDYLNWRLTTGLAVN
jgi:outer membrane protein TolC